MSIIYDALQKTQRSRSNHPNNKASHHLRWLDISMFAIIIILFAIIIYAYYPRLEKLLSLNHKVTRQPPIVKIQTAVIPVIKSKPPTRTTVTATKTSGKLTLNGVFISPEEKFVLINNQTLHIGDSIEGMKIVDINFDKVYLRDEKLNLILKTA